MDDYQTSRTRYKSNMFVLVSISVRRTETESLIFTFIAVQMKTLQKQIAKGNKIGKKKNKINK